MQDLAIHLWTKFQVISSLLLSQLLIIAASLSGCFPSGGCLLAGLHLSHCWSPFGGFLFSFVFNKRHNQTQNYRWTTQNAVWVTGETDGRSMPGTELENHWTNDKTDCFYDVISPQLENTGCLQVYSKHYPRKTVFWTILQTSINSLNSYFIRSKFPD